MAVEIREIAEKNLGAFIDYPYGLFREDPHWVGDLKKDVRHLLETGHPFWRHGERKLLMVFRDGRPLGRIAAIVNQAHNNYHSDKAGFFGFFDCVNDREVSGALFAAACAWLKGKGMDSAVGPVNPSTNETCGMLLEGFDGPPMVMMPYNPPYYLELAEAAGFSKTKDLYAYKYPVASGFPERFDKILARANRDGKVTIHFADVKGINKAIEEVKDVYNSAWEKNWGFVPMTADEMDDLAQALKPMLKPEYLYFAHYDGKPAGFVLLLPDFNIALKHVAGALGPLNILPFLYRFSFKLNRGRMLTMGVKQEFRGKGIEIALIKQAILAAKKMGWEYGEMSWTLEDNTLVNSVIEALGSQLYRKYRIFEKKL
jgi:GNAT superfamily N-acetyltransferase